MIKNTFNIILLLCCMKSTHFAQQADHNGLILHLMDQFDAAQKGVWINHYNGLSNKGESYLLLLAHDRREVHGFLIQSETRDTFTLEGLFYPEKLKLILLDSSYEQKGFLLADYVDKGLYARIMDPGKEAGRFVEFIKVDRDGLQEIKCPPDNWYKSYVGIMDRAEVFVQIQRESDLQVYGSMSIPSKQTGYLLSGNCHDASCKKLDLVIHDFFGERIKEFSMEVMPDKRIEVTELFKGKTPLKEYWTALSSYKFVCLNYSIPGIRIYAQYLELGDRDFDIWINAFFKKWTDQVTAYYQGSPLENTKEHTGFMDIDWINNDWVSGIFRFNEPWSDQERNLCFTYDRKYNRIISIDELFDKEFDHSSYFSEYIDWKKKEMMSINTSKRFSTFLLPEPFSQWTLRPEGLCFTSNFNRVWGLRKIIAPYPLIENKIRKSGPLRKLF